jgi:hypothetical protein
MKAERAGQTSPAFFNFPSEAREPYSDKSVAANEREVREFIS